MQEMQVTAAFLPMNSVERASQSLPILDIFATNAKVPITSTLADWPPCYGSTDLSLVSDTIRKSGAAVQAGLVYEDVHKTAQTASQAANPAAEAVPAVFPGSASEVPFTDLPSRNQHQKDHIDLAAATPITVKLEKSESAELSPVNSPAGRPKRARRQPEFYNPSPGQRAVSHVVSIDTTDIDSETSQEEHKTHEISGRARSTRHTPTHQQGHSQAVPQPVDLPNDANVEDAAPAAAMAGRLPASAASDQPELLWSGSQGSLSVRTSSESYPDSKSPSPRGTPTACQAAAHEQQSTMNAETAARQGPQQQSQLHDVDRLARTGGPPLTEAVDERGCDAPHSPHATSALQSAPSQVPSLAAVESAVHVSISAAISAVNKKLSSQSAIVQGQMRNYTNLHELLELYNALDMVDFKNNLRDVGKLDLNQTLYMYDHIKECRESR